MDATLPIGVFDSGVGGLTVLDAMRKAMPGEDYLYLGDTARLPYGNKSPSTIIRYTCQAAARLVEQRVKMLVVACNTMSAVALPKLGELWPDVTTLGVVEPGAQAACAASPHGRIAVIATRSTVSGGAYPKAILRHRPEATVQSLACPLFVPLAEEAWFDGPLVEGIVAHYLTPLFATSDRPDCLVLACTHYPLLAKPIRRIIGDGPCIVDSAETTARAAKKLLEETATAHPQQHNRKGVMRFFTTDNPARFARTGSLFLGETILEQDVTVVDL